MEKGRGVSMKKWALLSLQHIPRQEETAPLQAELSSARGVEGRCFPSLSSAQGSNPKCWGPPQAFQCPAPRGCSGVEKEGVCNASMEQGKGRLYTGKSDGDGEWRCGTAREAVRLG